MAKSPEAATRNGLVALGIMLPVFFVCIFIPTVTYMDDENVGIEKVIDLPNQTIFGLEWVTYLLLFGLFAALLTLLFRAVVRKQI